jgi:hypothetical protein
MRGPGIGVLSQHYFFGAPDLAAIVKLSLDGGACCRNRATRAMSGRGGNLAEFLPILRAGGPLSGMGASPMFAGFLPRLPVR